MLVQRLCYITRSTCFQPNFMYATSCTSKSVPRIRAISYIHGVHAIDEVKQLVRYSTATKVREFMGDDTSMYCLHIDCSF